MAIRGPVDRGQASSSAMSKPTNEAMIKARAIASGQANRCATIPSYCSSVNPAAA